MGLDMAHAAAVRHQNQAWGARMDARSAQQRILHTNPFALDLGPAGESPREDAAAVSVQCNFQHTAFRSGEASFFKAVPIRRASSERVGQAKAYSSFSMVTGNPRMRFPVA
jgi:hypothetical protein